MCLFLNRNTKEWCVIGQKIEGNISVDLAK